MFAPDSQEAKEKLMEALKDSPINVVDAGNLKRAREMEAIGFLQMALTASEQVGWDAGFGVIKERIKANVQVEVQL